VTQVYWDDADAFCRWLTASTGRVHRLPTEAEWAWACRAGDARDGTFPATDPNLQRHAWLRTNSGKPCQPQPVGRRLANPWGLHDTHGNVAELCDDYHGDHPVGTHTDFRGSKPDHHRTRVLMGSSYLSVVTGFAQRGDQRTCGAHAGFRVLRVAE
jgi:formylglycine-generating enzyme required for sulfatase activity